jgi:hypothetical protein
MENFDIIYYINLEDRPDRNNSIRNELTKMGVDMSKVQRIDAIKNNVYGGLGCSASHVKCLEYFESSGFQNCLILEDDFVFKNEKDFTNNMISNFFEQNVSWDVLMLSGLENKIVSSKIVGLNKAISIQTASGYAVHRRFLPKLKTNFIEGFLKFKETLDYNKYAIDQYWKVLQPCSNWYIFEKKIGYQRDDYSSIEKKFTIYPDKYDYDLKNYKGDSFVIGVVTCKMNYHLAEQQFIKYFNNIDKYPITYLKIIGDENLDTQWLYNENENLLIIKCDDGYLNLPNKVFQFIKISKKIFRHFVGIFKTDDDIEINLNNLYNMLMKYKDIDYFGNYAGSQRCKSNYLMTKKNIIEQYPLFGKYLVETDFGHYCSGGGYYLNQKAIKVILDNESYFPEFSKNDYKKYLYNNEYFKGLNVFEDKSIGVILNKNNIFPNQHDFDHRLYNSCVKWN